MKKILSIDDIERYATTSSTQSQRVLKKKHLLMVSYQNKYLKLFKILFIHLHVLEKLLSIMKVNFF